MNQPGGSGNGASTGTTRGPARDRLAAQRGNRPAAQPGDRLTAHSGDRLAAHGGDRLAAQPGDRRYRGQRRYVNPYTFLVMVAATPLSIVLAIVGLTAIAPYTPSQARADNASAGIADPVRPAPLVPFLGGPSGGPSPQGDAPSFTGPSISPSPALTGIPSRHPKTGAPSGHPIARTAPAPVAVAKAVVYLASDPLAAVLGTSTAVRRLPAPQGDVVVTQVGHGSPGGDVTFTSVLAPSAGRYTLVIEYVPIDANTRELTLVTNGASTVLQFPGNKTVDQVRSLSTVVNLTAGSNVLRLFNATDYGPDLDRITLNLR